MTYVDADVAAYRASGHTERTLRFKRNVPVGQEKDSRELRIGFRSGFGDRSLVPDVRDDTSGLIDCSVPPCSPSAGGYENYPFMIDRISEDGNTVFARSSYELLFQS